MENSNLPSNVIALPDSAPEPSSHSTQKKNKLNSLPPPADKVPDAEDFWIIRNHNPKDLYVGDFSEFALGRVEAGSRIAALKWNGEIRPRPILARDLVPAIKEDFLGRSSGTGRQMEASFRAFWRFLDGCEGTTEVRSLADLTDLHGVMLCAASFQSSQLITVRKFVNLARERASLPPLYWTIPEGPESSSTAPELEHIKAIHHRLIGQVFDGTFRRWDEADRLASSGTDWSTHIRMRPTGLPWSDADRHATYRGFAVLAGNPCPMPRDTGGVNSRNGMGIRWDSPAIQPLPPLVEGLFPTRNDVVNLIHLFMIRTGWNGSTTLNIDVNNYLRPHPTSEDHHVVHAIKARPSAAEQCAIGQNKSERSPGNLLKRQIERTEPLREMLRKELALRKAAARTQPYTDARALEISELEGMVRSPWIYCSVLGAAKVGMVDGQSLHRKDGASLRNVIRDVNLKRGADRQIPELKASDFRDGFIGYAHARNGHTWFVAMLAGQHRSPRSATPYLSHMQNKSQAWATISFVSNALWKEIKERRIADPAVLRFLVANGEISEEQRLRWMEHKSLTRVGMGCRDSKSPPASIAPDHVAGDTCRVQRCTLCHNGILLEGSVDHLSRRKVELLRIQLDMGMAAWEESSFPAELQGLEWNLVEYDDHERKERFQFWTTEVKEGRHRVPSFVGSYA